MNRKIVTTQKGQLSGYVESGVERYLGIPFAKPPVGELRFLPPVENEAWVGVRDAITLPNSPMQPIKENGKPSRKLTQISEDCLYLNVYTPENSEGRNLPVMYWIYGGGYTVGSSAMPLYDGENFVKNNDVILVTANYRVGIFGFMSHPALSKRAEHHTNAGVADAIAGLTWVKNNIEAFGGNPNNVTVFGQSAGSSLINILLLSPVAKGLFHAAITQSGSPFNHDEWDIDTEQTYDKCRKYMESIGIMTEDDLYNAPAEKFLQDPDNYARAEFCPYVDGYILPDRLEQCFLKGHFHDVPVMLGCTTDEASSLVNGGDAHGSRSKTTKESFGKTVDIKYPIKEHNEFIWEKYGPYAEYDAGYALYRFRSDNTAANMRYFASCLKDYNESPVYYYMFQHVPPTHNPSFLGAHHGCEVNYIFQNFDADKEIIAYGSYDEKIGNDVSAYWANFARNHHPNSDNLPHWEEFTPENNMIMYLDGPCECREIKNKAITDTFERFLAERTEANNPGLLVKTKKAINL